MLGFMEARETIRRVWETLEEPLAMAGFELIEVEWSGGGREPILRLFLDTEDGVTLDDCTEASRLVSPLLDMAEIIPGHYLLEVSSPGIDRPLRKAAHFERFRGERVKLHAVAPVEGRKRFTGTLQGVLDGLVHIDCDGHDVTVHLENIEKAKLVAQ